MHYSSCSEGSLPQNAKICILLHIITMTKQHTVDIHTAVPAESPGTGAPDLVTIPLSLLVREIAAEMFEYFDWPRAGPELSEPAALLLASAGVQRAMLVCSLPRSYPVSSIGDAEFPEAVAALDPSRTPLRRKSDQS